MPPSSSAGPSLGETMARPPTADLGATFVRPPQAIGETIARDVTTVSGGSLQQSVHERLAASAADSDDPIRIGRFTVLRMLGEGGMGVVYAAYDIELDRKVAIKLVRESATEGTIGHTSMLREAQAMAKLSHPHVVQIYEVGLHEEQVFVAMEFVKGRTLTAWLTEAPRTWKEIRDMFVQAGHGLAAAHAEGLVHRDFKPDNVLVGGDERARVADFGLAGIEQGNRRRGALSESARLSLRRLGDLDAELTVAGAVQGTPAYMSPEQHRGDETDARTDLFSLCVALWEALYGERPFPGDTLESLAAAVTQGQLRPRPATTEVPEWLHAALVAGLATDREQRTQTIDELIFQATFDVRQLPRPRTWRIAGAIAAAAVLAATTAYLAVRERDPTPEELAAIAALAGEARTAADARHWVYPDATAPDATAILRVAELEAQTGPPARSARAQAGELRLEFAAALIALGDRYWDAEGTRPFARDFYVQGMIFEPTNPLARERSGLTPGQFADLEARALTGEFTLADIVAAEPLAILVDADTPLRRARLGAYQARNTDGTAMQKVLLTPLVDQEALLAAAEAAVAATPRSGAGGRDVSAAALVAEPAVDAAPEPTPEGPAPPEAQPDAAEVGPALPPEPPKRPRKVKTSLKVVKDAPPPAPRQSAAALALAQQLATDGEAARQQGDLDAAERLFHQALAEFSACLPALVGLADVYYDRSQHVQAAGFAERAVVVAPDDPAPRLSLGDIYVKLLRYRDARVQYERAAALGHPQAAARLQKIAAKLGG